MAAFINSTVINTAFNHTQPYFSVFEEVSKYNVQLNYFERLWAAWYLWMQNDTLATGIMSFVMHETVYFGRSLPFIIFDLIPWFHKYKIQPVSTDAPAESAT
ncbi:C-4 sterol methyl oxidase [Colletotrichum tofieldiae]|nr:C-4 sterol methyl oxidase [Colletotrichum tofieldiae]GKT85315.1 C-4 sterol methyl oxidase [Colletotrichum tofieldiae]